MACCSFKKIWCLILGIFILISIIILFYYTNPIAAIAIIVLIFLLSIVLYNVMCCCCCNTQSELEGIQAELNGSAGGTIPNGANVIFDNILNDQSDAISYDDTTGEFTITEPGNYIVTWWATADGADPSENISFALTINGIPYATASSPIVTTQISASNLVTVNTTPSTVALINVTGTGISIPEEIPVQAGIVISR